MDIPPFYVQTPWLIRSSPVLVPGLLLNQFIATQLTWALRLEQCAELISTTFLLRYLIYSKNWLERNRKCLSFQVVTSKERHGGRRIVKSFRVYSHHNLSLCPIATFQVIRDRLAHLTPPPTVTSFFVNTNDHTNCQGHDYRFLNTSINSAFHQRTTC